VSDVFDDSEIVTDNLVRWGEEEGKGEPGKHENEECDVSSVIDILESSVPVLSNGNSRPNDSAEIEDSPEVSNISSLLFLNRI